MFTIVMGTRKTLAIVKLFWKYEDQAKIFPANPILLSRDIKTSEKCLQVLSLLNPGGFHFEGKHCWWSGLQKALPIKKVTFFFGSE